MAFGWKPEQRTFFCWFQFHRNFSIRTKTTTFLKEKKFFIKGFNQIEYKWKNYYIVWSIFLKNMANILFLMNFLTDKKLQNLKKNDLTRFWKKPNHLLGLTI